MFYAIFISMIVVYGFLAIYKGLKSGCWPIVLMLVILFVYKSCEQYEEDWGENGRFAPKSETTIPTHESEAIRSISTTDYYPTQHIDQSKPDSYPPASSQNRYWQKGYEAGYEAGETDWALNKPYFSYDFEGYYPRQKGATWRQGYWVGYSKAYPGVPRLTRAQVDSMYHYSKL